MYKNGKANRLAHYFHNLINAVDDVYKLFHKRLLRIKSYTVYENKRSSNYYLDSIEWLFISFHHHPCHVNGQNAWLSMHNDLNSFFLSQAPNHRTKGCYLWWWIWAWYKSSRRNVSMLLKAIKENSLFSIKLISSIQSPIKLCSFKNCLFFFASKYTPVNVGWGWLLCYC